MNTVVNASTLAFMTVNVPQKDDIINYEYINKKQTIILVFHKSAEYK